ncbi:MAG: hypothetical protein G8345_17485 [Magnetococcales bacterium]|nr:hypothetical protein [Magnetococcales bacterium]NGZ28672.1 hypothetical protein [Magnetococcales bacterium]
MLQRLSFFMAVVWLLSSPAWASVSVSGTLTAKEACPAYLSTKKENNPDRFKLTVGSKYPIFELNTPAPAEWLRIRIVDGTQYPERWVKASCGTTDLSGVKDDTPSQPPSDSTCKTTNCNRPDQEDSFVLSLSWQPSFCASNSGRSKPECVNMKPTDYGASHFTLHGLWPNKSSCGINYGYCGSVCQDPPRNPGDPLWMCTAYPEVPWNGPIPASVNQVMPSIDAGSCLDRHEWFKHGTCAASWKPTEYFGFAAALVQEFNQSAPGQMITNSAGKQVSRAALMASIDDVFGQGASKRVSLECSNDQLTGISFELPPNVDRTETLKELLQQGPAISRSKCDDSFSVQQMP